MRTARDLSCPGSRSLVKVMEESSYRERRMRLVRACVLVGVVVGAAATGWAESKNVADYPLRLHIFSRNETTFYHHEWVDDTKGEGRANLFENGEARGLDFNFNCSERSRRRLGMRPIRRSGAAGKYDGAVSGVREDGPLLYVHGRYGCEGLRVSGARWGGWGRSRVWISNGGW